MALVYLLVNGLLYLALGVWCTVLPEKTAGAIGFALTNASARSEYVTVYGGLEVGLGLFFLATAFQPGLRATGLLLALCTYGALAIFRTGTLLKWHADVGRFPWVMLAVEVPMAVLALWLWLRAA